VNPLLAGVAVCIIYAFVRRAASERLARVVALLFALSPFVLFMAGTQLDHLGALVFVRLAIATLPKWREAHEDARARRQAAIIGASLGAAVSIRPYDTALVTLVIGVFQLREAWRNPALRRSLGVQVLAGLVPVVVLLACNAASTGHPFTFAYDLLNGSQHRPGFHVDPFGLSHTPRRGLFNISAYLMRLDVSLLAWPVPALVLVVAALAFQRSADRWDYLLVGALGVILVGYWAYWGEGRSPGPRFLFTVAPVFLLYVARFPHVLAERARGPVTRRASALLLPIWLLAAWLAPPIAAQPFGIRTLSRRLSERDVATPLVLSEVARQRLAHAVIFVDDGWHARLASRLRALGARPFMAQRIVGHHDACALQQLLDSAEHTPSLVSRQSQFVFADLERMPDSPPIPDLPALEQLALDPERARSAECERALSDARSNGLDLARFLPLEAPDSLGRLDGDVLYVRDHRERNVLLRERFADRRWYRARVDIVDGRMTATVAGISNH
jgi:4-amino-4-deoxy-L-arabinose transferase-like glycosyltransferase